MPDTLFYFKGSIQTKCVQQPDIQVTNFHLLFLFFLGEIDNKKLNRKNYKC